jgi:subtilisin family serine protease
VAVKVLDSAGSGTLAWFQCAVNWIKNSGSPRADVATMSAGLGVPPLGITTLNGETLDLFGWDAVAEQLPNADIPFTVAAGNWIGPLVEILDVDETTQVGVNGVNQVSSPGIAPKVVAVGAVTEYGVATHFTALGPGRIPTQQKPDVAAMGFDTWGALTGTTTQYEQWAGTSMATPLAAGVIAILMDKDNTKSHTVYENALRNGAARECIIANSPTPGDCFLGTQHPLDPNFVVGHGVVKASASLALI